MQSPSASATACIRSMPTRSAICCCTCWPPTAAGRRWCSRAPSMARTSCAATSTSTASASPRSTATRARVSALADFKNGKTTVLVATDIAARGLDIAQLPAVVNYDLPMVAQDYVHRIGRTGRAGAEGLALSLVSREEEGLLRDIRRLLKQDIAIEPIEGFEPAWSLRLDNPAPAMRKQGRNNGKAPRNNAK